MNGVKVVCKEKPAQIESKIKVNASNNKEKIAECWAVWDTGAERSSMSYDFYCALNPQVIGYTEIHGTTGTLGDIKVCKVDIELYQGKRIDNLEVTVIKDDIKAAFLIGMDIIADGDFRIRKRDSGEWVFTFNN